MLSRFEGALMYKEVPDALQIAVTVGCGVQRARSLLTTEQGLSSWFATTTRFTPEVGAELRLEVDPRYGGIIEGRIKGYDPGSGIAYTYVDDLVKRAFGLTVARWAWEPLSADYTLLTMTHTGHSQGDSWQKAFEVHVRSWTFYLSNLVSVVNEGRDKRPVLEAMVERATEARRVVRSGDDLSLGR